MKKCPKCNNKNNVKEIKYGYIASTNSEDILGGCMISDSAPKYFCTNCEEHFDMLASFYEMYEGATVIAFASKLFDSITVYSSKKLNDQSHSVDESTYTTIFDSLKEASLMLTGETDGWQKKSFNDEEEYTEYFSKLLN